MNGLLRFIPAVVVIMTLCGFSLEANAEGVPEAPPLRQIPGIIAPDQFPQGCVDCHVNRPDLKRDVRLSTVMRHWQDKVDPMFLARIRPFVPVNMELAGKHPAFEAESADIPQACLQCHENTSEPAPPLGPLLHGLHLVGGEENHFLSKFQGECTLCHKLNAQTGEWSLGSGREGE
ncbi:hypothetical protein GCM10011352_14030 [Marinobacterium zhoushanense]|uniref:Uncharacterized protein n=1 Tax=Marinobacterium zhoushanense TaxID=1679163 RepID=A0ABQ1K7Q3_9GAMM|nr:hypothetical protein [Marinobacterium zhoushanense]GGB89239.1 hypothetical protein GCM10011352_14030 [Marinobacterium zhoushanense]